MRGLARAWPAVLVLAGCAVGPTYQPPPPTASTTWSAGAAKPESPEALQGFWGGFDDPMLADLVRQAIDGNLDLKVATQRIRAANDAVQIAASAGAPQVELGAAAEARRQTQTLDWPPRSPAYGEYPVYALGLNASWELDLFGETARRREAAQASAEAMAETRRGILVSLTAAVAGNYAGYRAAEARLQVARAALETARQNQALVRRAYAAGDRPHLDVSEADARVHALEAGLPPLQAQAEALAHALAILLGRAPAAFQIADPPGPVVVPAPPPLPASLPSEVIARRPDIRRAEREYAQANALVGASMAALYPHFSIPLSFGPTTSALHDAFRGASLLWRVGLNGTQALSTGGRLSANVDAAQAAKAAALLGYRQTVLKAFGEVEDALSVQASERARQQALAAQVADSRQALHEAQTRHRAGQVGLLPVLDAEQRLLAAEDARVSNALGQCLAAISLYKAIGGGWEGVALPEPTGVRAGEATRPLPPT